MKSLLIFIPKDFPYQRTGFIYGKITTDLENEIKKFYILGLQADMGTLRSGDFIGCYSEKLKNVCTVCERKVTDWIHLNGEGLEQQYHLQNVIIDNKQIDISKHHSVVIVYNNLALIKAELFSRENDSLGNHFSELKEILQKKFIEDKIRKKNMIATLEELLLVYNVWLFMYPVMFLYKITSKFIFLLKYSTLGLHLNGWLENFNWVLMTVVEEKKLNLKVRNHLVATIVDIVLGVLAIQFLLDNIQDVSPSQILLDNAERVVDSLKNLIHWLMGAPAGLKLNLLFNEMLGKFFLYHIHLWWTFLLFIKPVMDLFFRILLLFGRLGITFQVAIAADLLALASFHSYCIYVYAARLFNIQIRGLVALFRLFLGKKKNPLRERVDSCQYQADQLFVGTLLFTILLFLMPTTWAYYTVFTSLRLILIGLGGFLTRLRFYLEVIPCYTFFCWLFRSKRIHSSPKLLMKSRNKDGSITLIMKTVPSSWSNTWIHCIPDTITHPPKIEWGMIVHNILSGQLLYPL